MIRKKILNPVLNQLSTIEAKQDAMVSQHHNLLTQFSELLPHIIELDGYQVVALNNVISYFCVLRKEMEDPIAKAYRSNQISLENGLFKLFTNPGTFIDLGANIGAFSLSFAAMGWNGYAFEASQMNVDLLYKSVALNGFDIEIINKAIHEKSGVLRFIQSGPYGMIASSVNKEKENERWEEVPCISLDEWCMLSNAPEKIDFIKIDIEGSEVSALRGAGKMLAKYEYPPIFVESNIWTLFLHDYSQKDLFLTASEIGYKIYKIDFTHHDLMEYDINCFPVDILTDFLLLKDIPENLHISNISSYTEEPELTIEVICRGLKSFLGDKTVHENNENAAFCYNLKDFPKYTQTVEIKQLLERISNEHDDNAEFSHHIDWYKIEQSDSSMLLQ